MNGYRLTLADNSIDAVLEVDMLHQVNQPELVIAEILRVLKPGGYFLQYGGWTAATYTDEQQTANEKYTTAQKDIQDFYGKAISEAGYETLLFSAWEQAAECKSKHFTPHITLENTGCYDSKNLEWTLGMGLHKTKTRAAGQSQLIPNDIHNSAWAKVDAYAREKYGNDYEEIKRYYNDRSGIVVYKRKF